MPETLSLSRRDGVGELLINSPAKRNALNRAMLGHLPVLLDAAAADPDIHVLIVTGGAGRPFSTGADISEFEEIHASAEATRGFAALFSNAQTALANFAKPTIAMISGYCIGGGCGLALGCDVRLADTNARFAITPAKLGLDYGLADTRRLVDAIGFARASDLLFSARLIDAQEALGMGLISRLVDPTVLEEAAWAWATEMAAMSPASQRGIKATLNRIRQGVRDDDEISREAFMAAFAGADFQEGRRAFADRRRPDFTRRKG